MLHAIGVDGTPSIGDLKQTQLVIRSRIVRRGHVISESDSVSQSASSPAKKCRYFQGRKRGGFFKADSNGGCLVATEHDRGPSFARCVS